MFIFHFSFQDPFHEARNLAAQAIKLALQSIDFTLDPPLNVPEKYKHMVWFALPMEIVMAMLGEIKNGAEVVGDVNTIPFIPDDAKVNQDDDR